MGLLHSLVPPTLALHLLARTFWPHSSRTHFGPMSFLPPDTFWPLHILVPSKLKHILAPSLFGPRHILAPSLFGPRHILAPSQFGPGHILAPPHFGPRHILAPSQFGPGRILAPSQFGPFTFWPRTHVTGPKSVWDQKLMGPKHNGAKI